MPFLPGFFTSLWNRAHFADLAANVFAELFTARFSLCCVATGTLGEALPCCILAAALGCGDVCSNDSRELCQVESPKRLDWTWGTLWNVLTNSVVQSGAGRPRIFSKDTFFIPRLTTRPRQVWKKQAWGKERTWFCLWGDNGFLGLFGAGSPDGTREELGSV